MITNKTFNKQEFIKNYQLTKEEYFFLPLEERMEYVRKYYGHLLESISNVGDICRLHYFLPSQFNEFFVANGCLLEYFDFDCEETQITRIKDVKIEPNAEARQRLDEYICQVAGAKADMFKNILVDIYKAKIDALNLENSLPLESINEKEILNNISLTTIVDTDLPTEVKEYIMAFQLSSITRKVDEEGFAEIDIKTALIGTKAALEYFEYLEKIGYVLEEPYQERLNKYLDADNLRTTLFVYIDGELKESTHPYQTIKVLKKNKNNV